MFGASIHHVLIWRSLYHKATLLQCVPTDSKRFPNTYTTFSQLVQLAGQHLSLFAEMPLPYPACSPQNKSVAFTMAIFSMNEHGLHHFSNSQRYQPHDPINKRSHLKIIFGHPGAKNQEKPRKNHENDLEQSFFNSLFLLKKESFIGFKEIYIGKAPYSCKGCPELATRNQKVKFIDIESKGYWTITIRRPNISPPKVRYPLMRILMPNSFFWTL